MLPISLGRVFKSFSINLTGVGVPTNSPRGQTCNENLQKTPRAPCLTLQAAVSMLNVKVQTEQLETRKTCLEGSPADSL